MAKRTAHAKRKIHVLVADTKHGSWVRAFKTYDALHAALAIYVRDDWREQRKLYREHGFTDAPPPIPRDPAKMIEQYVEDMDGDFSYWAAVVEIEGG